MKVLAIDPGYERVGIAVLEKDRVVFSECFKTSSTLSFGERLALIGKKITETIEKYGPKALSIETLFLTNNQKTVMHVAEARGIIIYEAQKAGLGIFEFTPLQIKIAVTGYGKADKKAVMEMVKKLVKVEQSKTSDDELDAIAAGITFFACLPPACR